MKMGALQLLKVESSGQTYDQVNMPSTRCK